MRTIELKYDEVEQFAQLYCKFQRIGRGDLFATDSEFKMIQLDIFGWTDLWLPALVESLDYSCSWDLWVDHNKKLVEVRIYPN